MTSNSYTYDLTRDKNEKKQKLNLNPIVFGAVAIISQLHFNANTDQIRALLKPSIHSIQTYDLTKRDEESNVFTLRTNLLEEKENLSIVNLSKSDILNKDITDETEVLDVEELRRLQDKFDKFVDDNHKMQLTTEKSLTSLTTEFRSFTKEITRLNDHQEKLPGIIREELSKIKVEKSEGRMKTFIAPIITGLVLLLGQYLLNLL